MLPITRMLAALWAIFIFVFSPAHAVEYPATISIRASAATVKTGDPVILQTAITNTSKSDLVILAGSEFSATGSYDISVVGPSGNPATLTRVGRGHFDTPPDDFVVTGSPRYFKLKPREELRAEIVISNLFDMNNPGKYTIQISRDVPNSQGNARIVSNEVVVNIEK